MRNNSKTILRNLSFGILTSLLLLILIIAIATHIFDEQTITNPLIKYAVRYHVIVMLFLVVISIAFGFFWSWLSLSQLKQVRSVSKSMLDTILLGLSDEEQRTMRYLMDQNGKAKQSEVAKLPGMNRVRAHRALQKMQQKKLVSIEPHGKMRYVTINDNVFNLLQDS